MTCNCIWPPSCDGLKTLYCEGCGGDTCVCECGGEIPCGGCDECASEEEDDDDDESF